MSTTGVPLRWTNDQAGYQCPYCGLFVCIPLREWATCPRCPNIPIDETANLLLEDAGIDESDRDAAISALGVLLNALPTPTPAADESGAGA